MTICNVNQCITSSSLRAWPEPYSVGAVLRSTAPLSSTFLPFERLFALLTPLCVLFPFSLWPLPFLSVTSSLPLYVLFPFSLWPFPFLSALWTSLCSFNTKVDQTSPLTFGIFLRSLITPLTVLFGVCYQRKCITKGHSSIHKVTRNTKCSLTLFQNFNPREK